MNAQQIIDAITQEVGADLSVIKNALEDGAALAAIGVTNDDQDAVEDAHDIISTAMAGKKPMLFAIRWNEAGAQPICFREDQAAEFAARYGFDAGLLDCADTDIELLDEDGNVVGWVLPA